MIDTPDTLGDLRDLNPESALVKHMDRASRLVGGYNFDDCQIRSHKEMGQAAGLWELGPEQMAIREDMVSTPKGQCLITHVLVHEALHAGGILLEGFTEAEAAWLTGENPMAYHSEVEAAQDFFKVVGRARSLRLAKKKDAEESLLAAYIHEKVQRSIPAVLAMKEGKDLLEKARGAHG